LYELDKHIGMTTVKLLSNEDLMFGGALRNSARIKIYRI